MKILNKERATWEYSAGEDLGDYTKIARRSSPDEALVNFKGDCRPDEGHHFEIWIVDLTDEEGIE